jgi:hypothetical protein
MKVLALFRGWSIEHDGDQYQRYFTVKPDGVQEVHWIRIFEGKSYGVGDAIHLQLERHFAECEQPEYMYEEVDSGDDSD